MPRKKKTDQVRQDGDWKIAFLASLRKNANVSFACSQAGITRPAAYQRKREDGEFARQWRESIQAAIDRLEQRAFEMAEGGNTQLMITLLKAHKRKRYGDRPRDEQAGSQGPQINIYMPANGRDPHTVGQVVVDPPVQQIDYLDPPTSIPVVQSP